MTVTALPLGTFELPWYVFNCALSGTRYSLTMRYNTRMDRWFLDISDAQRNLIFAGIPLALGRPLLGQHPTLALPAGEMVVVDNSGRELPATKQSFLTDHTVYYVAP